VSAAITDLKGALCRLLAELAVIPSATLTADQAPGSLVFPLSSTAGFVPGGLLRFLDGTADQSFVIDDLDTGTKLVTLSATASGGAPTAAHLSGALVATNLTTTFPIGVAGMLADSGLPVWSINAFDRAKKWETTGAVTPRYVLNLCHLLAITKPAAQTALDAQLWTERITQRAETDISAVETALQSNWTMLVDGIAYATMIEQFITSSRHAGADEYGVACWETWLTVMVRGNDELT
jgi:hypothetical protein